MLGHSAPRAGGRPTCDAWTVSALDPERRSVTVIDEVALDLEGCVSAGRLLIAPGDLERAIGWRLSSRGLCRDERCVPVRDPDALRAGGLLDLGHTAAALGRSVVVDAEAAIAAVALDGERRRRGIEQLEAPAFTLCDLDGTPHRSSAWSGRKHLVVTFSSWCGCRYDLPGWQALHDELAPFGFAVVAVALDDSPDDVRPFTEGLSIPVLIDPAHVLTELFSITNVPTVVWIDERGRIARPIGEAFGSDTFADFTGAASAPHLDAVRHWVRDGELPLLPEAARGAVGDLSEDEVLARLHFRVAAEARRRGHDGVAAAHFDEAARLAPDDLTIWRAAMPLRGADPFGQEFLDRFELWRAAGSPVHGLPPVAG